MRFADTISNEQVNVLPIATFGGRIVVVDTPESMALAEEILLCERVVGFDTETRPAFTKGVSYKLALLQLSTADVAFLFRLQKQPLSQRMKDFVEDPSILKIGAAIRDDLTALQKSQGTMTPRGFIDLQTIASQWGILEKSVKKLSAITMGYKVSKAQRLSNWEAKILTPSQQQYAAIDAWICREIYLKLQETDKI
ncbi:MAG: 3'-5' exonuclease [Rikenellaceae bacterium]